MCMIWGLCKAKSALIDWAVDINMPKIMILEADDVVVEMQEGKWVTTIMASPLGFGLFKGEGFLGIKRRGGHGWGVKMDRNLDQ